LGTDLSNLSIQITPVYQQIYLIELHKINIINGRRETNSRRVKKRREEKRREREREERSIRRSSRSTTVGEVKEENGS